MVGCIWFSINTFYITNAFTYLCLPILDTKISLPKRLVT